MYVILIYLYLWFVTDNLLKEVLSIKPSTWEDDDYHSKTFSRKEISPSSSEYADVVSAFNTLRSVKKIERVQNPILFGKYKIRKEQLNKRGHNVNEVNLLQNIYYIKIMVYVC